MIEGFLLPFLQIFSRRQNKQENLKINLLTIFLSGIIPFTLSGLLVFLVPSFDSFLGTYGISLMPLCVLIFLQINFCTIWFCLKLLYYKILTLINLLTFRQYSHPNNNILRKIFLSFTITLRSMTLNNLCVYVLNELLHPNIAQQPLQMSFQKRLKIPILLECPCFYSMELFFISDEQRLSFTENSEADIYRQIPEN